MPPLPVRTHAAIDPRLSGRAILVEEGRAVVELATIPEMAADEHGLVHGGFVFSAADHAAMLAVNEPTVVLAAAEVRFTAPVRVGETVRLEAAVEVGGRPDRPQVECTGAREGEIVFSGRFRCAVLPGHVLEGGG